MAASSARRCAGSPQCSTVSPSVSYRSTRSRLLSHTTTSGSEVAMTSSSVHGTDRGALVAPRVRLARDRRSARPRRSRNPRSRAAPPRCRTRVRPRSRPNRATPRSSRRRSATRCGARGGTPTAGAAVGGGGAGAAAAPSGRDRELGERRAVRDEHPVRLRDRHDDRGDERDAGQRDPGVPEDAARRAVRHADRPLDEEVRRDGRARDQREPERRRGRHPTGRCAKSCTAR